MHPHVPPKPNHTLPPHCLILSLCCPPPPYISENCSHMSVGTPGSNTHLEKQHYYPQLTLNFGVYDERERERGGGGSGRRWMERLKKERQMRLRGVISQCVFFTCVHMDVCVCVRALWPPCSRLNPRED